jgi:quercetin dioxygenase-like cupin family protein
MKKSVSIVTINPCFVDKRGTISDLLNCSISHVGLIKTVKGAVRASHFHLTSKQYSYIVYGEFEVLTAPARSPKVVTRWRVRAGQLIIIEPRVIHLFRAIKTSLMIDMISKSREGDGYENDVERVFFGKGVFSKAPG